MNVYEKLNLARVKYQSSGVKMSGKNDFSKYSYYELSDILPLCNQICSEVKATCVVSFSSDLAKLEFIDCEKPEDKIIFTSPMSEASLKGCHAVQNLGAVQTYIKRYLYQHCFEIVENDYLNETSRPDVDPNENKNNPSNNYAQSKQTYEKKVSNEEITQCINTVLDYIANGTLQGAYAEKAHFNIKNRNLEGLKKTIEYCKKVGA